MASFAPLARLPRARRHARAKTGSRPPHSRGPYCGPARDHIDEPLPKTVAGLFIDLPKRNALARGYSRIQGDGTGNEGQL
jgi:hypothetical protein